MSDPHSEMHSIYQQVNSTPETLWPLTRDNSDKGWEDEVIRWIREKLGGRDLNLIPPERREAARTQNWSPRATYSCLPKLGPETTWRRFIHDCAHYTHQMLYGSEAPTHSVDHARLELELTELVIGWFKDEAKGITRSFLRLSLSRPMPS
jgi:hypothetical protein